MILTLFLRWHLVLWNRWRSGRLRLRLRRLHSRKHRRWSGSPCRKNRKRDRSKHENDRRPSRRPRKNRSRAARAKCRLAALAAESRRQVSALAALQQHDRDQKQANHNVNHYDQNGHCNKTPSGPRPRFKFRSSSIFLKLNTQEIRWRISTSVLWCGRGDLNPHAFRRHPLKMVCLPVPPLPHFINYVLIDSLKAFSVRTLPLHGMLAPIVTRCNPPTTSGP